MKEQFRRDPNILVSFITPLEVTSAIWRKAGVNADLRRESQRHYAVLNASWTVVDDYSTALADAMRLTTQYGLRAGDAIQLACALIATNQEARIPFVTLDEDLADAAIAEGFPVLP
jgi:predicted nucleic acid-binding protein